MKELHTDLLLAFINLLFQVSNLDFDFRGNMKHREQMFDIIRSEYSVTDTAIKRDPDVCVVKPCLVKETNAYYVEATGASVTADSSVSLLNKYCEMLPGDKYGFSYLQLK